MLKATILVVEDTKDLLRLVKLGLGQAGYKVLAAKDAETGLPLARKHKPDLVVLDVGLPGMSGLDFCRILRAESQVPIIFLTAKGKEVDKIVGLRMGADDYMTKPFSTGELEARVEAIFRRVAPRRAGEDGGAVSAGALEIDLERHEIRVKGKPAPLTAKEFQLLQELIRARGKVITRGDLLKNIWNYDPDMDVDTRTLDQLVARLRRKLGPERERLATSPGYGYRLKLG